MIPNVCFIKKEIGIQINQVDVGMGVKRWGRGREEKAGEKSEEEHSKSAGEKSEWLEVVSKLPFNQLWSAEKNKDGQTILSINERHPGYTSLYHELGRDRLRKN
jgi:hypothetical protein